ncbi:MAG TPA: AtpZ/AtpI family protein [Terriglobales bacterium]|nr:AtpZ/AtpI family protein [Terriglobales bacterium]
MADPQNSDNRSFWVAIARYSQLAFVLPAATFAGWVLGALVDRWLHTTWVYLVGLFLGIIAGFVELIRTVTRAEKEEDE